MTISGKSKKYYSEAAEASDRSCSAVGSTAQPPQLSPYLERKKHQDSEAPSAPCAPSYVSLTFCSSLRVLLNYIVGSKITAQVAPTPFQPVYETQRGVLSMSHLRQQAHCYKTRQVGDVRLSVIDEELGMPPSGEPKSQLEESPPGEPETGPGELESEKAEGSRRWRNVWKIGDREKEESPGISTSVSPH